MPLAIVVPVTAVDPPTASPRSALHSPSAMQHLGPIAEPLETLVPIPPSIEHMELLPNNDSQAPELSGLELLRQVFDSMATNGKITMDQLPFVLAGAEVQATAEQVQEAIEEFLPDADDEEALLDFDQVQTLYHQLVQVVADNMVDALLLAAEQERPPSAFRRFWQWLQRQNLERKMKQTSYERYMKPTTRLLLLILLTACVISTAVVVFAVLSIFDHTIDGVVDHLVRDTELLSDGLSMFGYTRPFEHANSNLQRLSVILGVVINDLGYANTKAYQLSNLAFQRELMGDLLDGWYSNDALMTVDTAVTITALWIERMVVRGTTLAELISAFNIINPNLPSGHEIQLARNTSRSLDFLTAWRFPSECVGTCGANNGSTPVRLALEGGNGTTLTGYDYRPQSVAAGYRLLTNPAGVALVYYVWQTTLQTDFQRPVKAVVDAINVKLASESNATSADVRVNSQEVVLCTKITGTIQNVTSMRFHNASTLVKNLDSTYLAFGLNSTGQGTLNSLDGEAIFVAYSPLQHSGLGLLVKIAQEEFLDALYLSLGTSLNDVNTRLSGTEEVQMVTTPKAGTNMSTNGMRYWTTFRFASDCGSSCGTVPNTSVYLQKALTECISGTDHSLDYRSKMVSAGYFCMSAMNAALAITIADSQIISEGTSMAVQIAEYQSNVRYAGKSTEVVVGRKKPGVKVAMNRSDFVRLSVRKFAAQCLTMTCDGPATSFILAVNGETGHIQFPDYRWVDSSMAYTYLPNLDLGILVKMDTSEAQAGSFRLTGILCGASISAVIVSMAVLTLLANILLKSMDRAWEEGKKAIEREKQAFRTVIEAMYPTEVAQRMLTGDTHIVYDVPAATVFFSDIYEFTTTSNTVTPEELIRFMGYTFGVMDAIGDYYHVHKVKTIGDAYLGVTGLPGMTSVNGSGAVDMMLFASACAQVFSNRFLHPDEGTILAEVVTRMLRKKNLLKGSATSQEARAATIPKRPSIISYGHPMDAAGVPAAAEDGSGPLVHCIMRYGLAMGPITAGVLQGKTPLFDIWGKTVNLASRMESTGQAGRIQVAEGVYQAVMMFRNQPFTFEGRHKVYCKGFGHVSAYFVDTCLIAPPKDLLVSLHIEPNWGNYLFQNPVPAFGGAKTGPQDPSHHNSNSGGVSPRSAQSQQGFLARS